MNRIEGKVAAFAGSREIVISVGRTDGVKPGMLFDVLSSKDAEVRDPDTGRTLGTLDRPIARVQAVDVQDRMTVCTTYVPNGPKSLEEALESLIQPWPGPGHSRRGPSRSSAPPLNPPDQYVRIGDRVRQVDDDPTRLTPIPTWR